MKLDTIGYLMATKEPELKRLVVKYGLTPAKDKRDLWRKMNYIVAKFKSEVLKDIAEIHPDRDLILWSADMKEVGKSTPEIKEIIKESFPIPAIVVEKESGACGCSGADGVEEKSNCGGKQEYSNCGGNPNCGCKDKEKKTESSFSNADGKSFTDTLKDNMPLVIIGSLLLVGGLIILGNRRVMS